ncbi:CAP domain-containing protein [Streptomyces sp. NBC_01198]|uniref:CAP domain-containing protein n=1 Tax=Streptomyces sp. NBC_01198 TaxID=2903769 RepID=UPI002E11DF57|nr:CAP domain-containing protein [Streptomyces sp. NBC_01198]
MGRHSRQAQPAAPQPGPPRGHRGRRKHHPVRTGLLATSAVMAVGAVAASSGLLSGVTGELTYNGGGNGNTQADGPSGLAQDGSDNPSPLGDTDAPIPGSNVPSAPGTPSPSATAPSARPGSATPATTTPPASTHATPTRTATAPTTPVRTPATKAPATKPSSDTLTATRAAILTLVNNERATAGCKPLTASSSLDGLAQAFSDDMAARGFFDHTDPDGHTPWDRAKARGITNLGGENIARGQADAQAVMTAWMNSPGHRANILNCDYTTLGVGIHFGTGGPWWTQDFGF